MKDYNLGDGVHFLPKSRAIVTYENFQAGTTARKPPVDYNITNKDDILQRKPLFGIAYWGLTNWFPQDIISVVMENSITPGLLNFKKLAAVGKGLRTYTEIIDGTGKDAQKIEVPVIDNELNDWLEEIAAENYRQASGTDAAWFYNTFTEVVMNRGGNRVNQLNRLEASNCRLSYDKKKLLAFESWEEIGFNGFQIEYPNYDRLSKRIYPRFGIHSKELLPGNSFYGFAPWIGSLNWIKTANEIPLFKLSVLKNGFSIKYHIKIPADYFLSLYPDTRINPDTQAPYTEKDRQQKEIALRQDMDNFLSGSANAGKTFISKYAIGYDGKPMPGWEIIPIEDNVKYDAYLDDYNTSNQAILSAHNINPSIASINTQGQLSSGSDMRNSFNIAVQMAVSNERNIVLEPLRIAKNITFPNKKNIKIGIENIELTTTDLVKSGMVANKPV